MSPFLRVVLTPLATFLLVAPLIALFDIAVIRFLPTEPLWVPSILAISFVAAVVAAMEAK